MSTKQPEVKPAWSARCDCYNNHNSSSGRCNRRNVEDPTRESGKGAYCERCRRECPAGDGPLAKTGDNK